MRPEPAPRRAKTCGRARPPNNRSTRRFDAAAQAWYPIAPVRTRPAALVVATALALALSVSLAGVARADVSSWMAIGGGTGLQLHRDSAHRDFAGSMTYSLGVGSSPLGSFVLGGLLRGQTFFGLGTDLGLAVRGSTGGFARGDWGVALDAGVLWRPWGEGDYGEWPIQAVLTLGAPWGVQLALGGEFASVSGGTSAQGFFGALEIDLLRLTVTRQGGTERWWPNPVPAGGHPRADSPPGASAAASSDETSGAASTPASAADPPASGRPTTMP
jgi:hypothetical protein